MHGKGKEKFFSIGDSPAAHISQVLKERLNLMNINLLQATSSGDLPNVSRHYKEKRTKELLEFIYNDFIPKKSKNISGVILSANWANDESIRREDILRQIQKTVQYLNSLKIKTLIIGQSELYHIPYTTIAARENQYSSKESHKFLKAYPYTLDKYLKSNLKTPYIQII